MTIHHSQTNNQDLSDLLGPDPLPQIGTNRAVALDLVRRGFAVFPCKEYGPKGVIKSPYTPNGKDDASIDLAQIRAWWSAHPKAIIGLPCKRNGLAVLDLDRHTAEQDGIAALRGLGYDPDSLSPFIVDTPSDGRHLYFRYQEGLGDSHTHLPDGVEIKASGYVIAPGSALADGRRYRAYGELEVAALPTWPTSLSPIPASDSFDLSRLLGPDPLPVDWAEVNRALPFISPDCSRDEWFRVGMALHAASDGSEAAFEIWNTWSATATENGKYQSGIMHSQWRSFGRKSGIDIGTLFHIAGEHGYAHGPNVTTDDFDDLPPLDKPPLKDWRLLLDHDKEKRLKKTAYNIRIIVENDATTAEVFALDEFRHRNFISKRPGEKLPGEHWQPGTVQDIHETAIRDWLSAPKHKGGWGIDASKENVRGAIDIAAHGRRFHPVRDRLATFEHDGKPRGEALFIEYLGCPDTPYFRETARLTLLGAVSRVFEPGHKFDFMPIIEGPQGVRKSTFVKALGMGWAGDPAINWGDGKEILEQTEGFWLIEIPELSSMSRAESNDIKANLTRTADTARLAYGHNPVTRPRQCVFIGTTNDRDYLKDPSGNRRFWPIPTNGTMIDTDRLTREAPQIWAEAVGWYRTMREAQPRDDLFLALRGGSAADAQALALQSSRRAETAEDALAGQIGAWLEMPVGMDERFDDLDADAPKSYRAVTCTSQIWGEMLQMRGAMPTNEAMRIGKALGIIGWNKSPNKTTHPELRPYGKCSVYTRG